MARARPWTPEDNYPECPQNGPGFAHRQHSAEPTWSPDGAQIAYAGYWNTCKASGGGGEIWVMNADGGGTGRDVLSGGVGNDRLTGGSGNDKLDGGTGRNVYSGGGGSDIVLAANGRRETINCGSGRDTVRADRTDKLRGCEKVRRLK